MSKNKVKISNQFKELSKALKEGEDINGILARHPNALKVYRHPIERRLGRSLPRRYSIKQTGSIKRSM